MTRGRISGPRAHMCVDVRAVRDEVGPGLRFRIEVDADGRRETLEFTLSLEASRQFGAAVYRRAERAMQEGGRRGTVD